MTQANFIVLGACHNASRDDAHPQLGAHVLRWNHVSIEQMGTTYYFGGDRPVLRTLAVANWFADCLHQSGMSAASSFERLALAWKIQLQH